MFLKPQINFMIVGSVLMFWWSPTTPQRWRNVCLWVVEELNSGKKETICVLEVVKTRKTLFLQRQGVFDGKLALSKYDCEGARCKDAPCLPLCMYPHTPSARVLACIKEPSFKRKRTLPKAGAGASSTVYMKGKIYIQRTFFSRFKLLHVTALQDQISACICFDVKPQMLQEYNGGVLEKVLWPEFCSCLFSEVCSVDCGTHGVCMGGACRCEEGWTGAGCDQRVCNPLCIKHGTCKDGKCQCHQGWNGEHCTIGQHLCVSVCARASVSDVCLLINYVGEQRHPVRLDCDSYFALRSGNLEMRKGWEKQIIRDLQGSAGETEGLKGSVWA